MKHIGPTSPAHIECWQDRLKIINRYILLYIAASPLTVVSVLMDLLVNDNVEGMFKTFLFYTLLIDGSLLLAWIVNRELDQALQRRKRTQIQALIARLGKESPTI